MIECVRGFMYRKGLTQTAAIKRFRENAAKNNVTIVNIVFCAPIGDGTFSIVANVIMHDARV